MSRVVADSRRNWRFSSNSDPATAEERRGHGGGGGSVAGKAALGGGKSPDDDNIVPLRDWSPDDLAAHVEVHASKLAMNSAGVMLQYACPEPNALLRDLICN